MMRLGALVGAVMRRTARLAAALLATALPAGGCGTLGTGGSQPEGLPHGGVGPFRLLRPEETGIAGTPAGILVRETRSVESAMIAEGHLFYAAAAMLGAPHDAGVAADAGSADADADADADAGASDAGPEHAPPQPDWSLHEPRRIFRSPPRADGSRGFDPGEPVLEASEAWEGGYVHDPWVLVAQGRARLYYAAERGIGLAEASAIDGAFTRIGGPVLELPGARRPSVVRTAGLPGARHALLMYVELDDAIRAYGSADGVAWTEAGPVTLPALPARDERDSFEVGIGSPGAVVFETPAGRSVLRLYYESRRADGSVLPTMAGSFDGETFEALGVPVVDNARDFTMPAPLRIDARISWLTMIASNGGRGAIVGAIAPAGATLP